MKRPFVIQSNEIDKILTFISDLLDSQEDATLKDTMNPPLYGKLQEIWDIQDRSIPQFVIHLVSNGAVELEPSQRKRFNQQLSKYSKFKLKHFLAQEIVERATKKDKKEIDANIQVGKKEMFEQSEGGIRALILNLNVRDCIRIVLDDDDIRLKANISDYKELTNFEISEDAFDDNVRLYLKTKPRINRNIRNTVLSEESPMFFYYNNGITITCSKFDYEKTSNPLIELKNIQVVNGSQTIHALYDALKEDYQKLENASLLCRIYQIKSKEVSAKIAQYTNSQNPVNNRDIKSIDSIQIKLENEFKSKGIWYERKKNQYQEKKKSDRLDSERVGQVLMSFYNRMPYEAKNDKKIIFDELYEDVFSEDINANKVLLAYKLFEYIEEVKESKKKKIHATPASYEKLSYLLYSSFYTLYIISDLCEKKGIPLELPKLEEIKSTYPQAIRYIEKTIEMGRKKAIAENKSFAYNTFFKSPNPKLFYEEMKQKKTRVPITAVTK